MKSLLLGFCVIAVGMSLAAGLGSASASGRSPTAAAKVSVASSALGRILVDGHGHTLYLFAGDKPGKSACAGKCAAFWPPLLASGKTLASAGAKAALLGTTRRADGRLQVTYRNHPLYTFAKDVRKGETNGEEVDAFGAKWYALSAAGARVERAEAPSSSTSDQAPGGYGYGY